MSRQQKKPVLFLTAFLLLLIFVPIAYFVSKNPTKTEAAWFDDSFIYRNKINITAHTAAENNVFVTTTIDTSATGQFQSDCGDLRFTSFKGETLPYFVVSGCTTSSTVVHIRFNAFPAGPQTILYYYGNPTVQDGFSSADFSTEATNYTIGTIDSQEKTTAPIFYWKLNEGLGTKTYDSSPSKYNGTLVGNSMWLSGDQCISDKCLAFDGTSNRVDTTTKLDSVTNELTVSAWVYPIAPADGVGRLIAATYQYNGTPALVRGWSLGSNYGSTDMLRFELYDSAGNVSRATVNNFVSTYGNKWIHVVATYKSGQFVKIYIDGKLIVQSTTSIITAIAPGTVNLRIGARPDSSAQGWWSGRMDEVKIYSYARTDAQIANDFLAKGSSTAKGTAVQMGSSGKNNDAFGNGLITHWKSDEATGNGADSSGNANATTVSGASNYDTGKYGNGFRTGVATTNTITNPSFETDLNSWSQAIYPSNVGGYGETSRIATESAVGAYSMMIKNGPGTSQVFDTSNITSLENTTYTYSCFIKANTTKANIDISDGTLWHTVYVTSGQLNRWVRLSLTFTTATGKTSLQPRVGIYGASGIVYADGCQIEQSATMTPYADGSLGAGHSWSGTAHASASTRTASTATSTTNINSTTGSIAFWFKSGSLDDTTSQCPFGPTDGDTTGGMLFALKKTGVFLTHKYASGVSVSPQYSGTINSGWNHVVYTWDNSTLKGNLYVNGSLKQTVTYAQAITTGEYLQNLGTCTATGYSTFNGILDDIRAYNRALSGTEVNKLFTYSAGPVAYYNFEEGSGTVIYDSSGNALNAGLSGTQGNQWTTGKFGKAGNFNGVNNIYTIGSSDLLKIKSQNWTVEYWFNTTTGVTDYRTVMGDSSSGNGTWHILSFSNSHYFRMKSSDASVYDFSTYKVAITNNQWVHAAFVVNQVGNSVTVSTYQNGVLLGSQTKTTTGTFDGTVNTILISSNYNKPIKLDEVKIYNYARTSGQVIEDMNGGHPLGGSPVGSQIGYWKFDEGIGTTANNSGNAGSSINGVLTGASTVPTWTNSGKFGKTVVFDGVDDYVTTADAPALDTTNMTISAWIKTSKASEQYVSERAPYYFATGVVGGKLCFYINSVAATWTCSTKTVTDDVWHYVAGTWDGTNKNLYIDGVLDTSVVGTGGNMGSSTLGLNIGTRVNAGVPQYFFSGLIDEVKIYNAALSADEIETDYNRGAATSFGSSNQTISGTTTSLDYCLPGDTTSCLPPVAEYKFEEGSGTSLTDTSNNGNTGTLTGPPLPSWVPGKLGKAMQFNGANYVDIGNGTALNPTTAFTIEGWVKPTALAVGTNFNLLAKENYSSKLGYRLFLAGTGGSSGLNVISIGVADGTNRTYLGGTNINSLNTWYHVAATFNNGALRIYTNGILGVQATSPVTTLSNTTTTATLGRYSLGGEYFTGALDQFRVYNYARTAAQIAWDYNQGKPVGWWKMDECQGNTIYDSTDNGKHGTLTVGAGGTQTAAGTCSTASTAWGNGATGKYNSSLKFDGVDDYVQIPLAVSGAKINSTGITFSAWIKTSDATSNVGSILGQDTSGGCSYYCLGGIQANYPTSGKVSVIVYNGSAYVYAQSLGNINDNNWHHIVGMYKTDGYLDLYVDGKFQNTANATSVYNSTPVRTRIGLGDEKGAQNKWFNGQIDDARVYYYPLTLEQIKQVYTNGAINFGPATGTP